MPPRPTAHLRAARPRAPLSCPRRAERDTDLGLARDRQLDDASRVNPTCVDLGATRADQRSRRVNKTEPRGPGPRLALTHEFVPRCGRRALAWPGHARQVPAVDPPCFAAIFRP